MKLGLIVTGYPSKEKYSLRKYITFCPRRLAIKVENLVAKQSETELKHRYFVSPQGETKKEKRKNA